MPYQGKFDIKGSPLRSGQPPSKQWHGQCDRFSVIACIRGGGPFWCPYIKERPALWSLSVTNIPSGSNRSCKLLNSLAHLFGEFVCFQGEN